MNKRKASRFGMPSEFFMDVSSFDLSTFAMRSANGLISLNQGNLHGNKTSERSNLKAPLCKGGSAKRWGIV